jgi:hypothetical protein
MLTLVPSASHEQIFVNACPSLGNSSIVVRYRKVALNIMNIMHAFL